MNVRPDGSENPPSGFGLAEVIVAIALLSITALSLVTVLVSSLRSDKKAFLVAAASNLAETELQRTAEAVKSDTPAGIQATFWEQQYPESGSPFRTGKSTISHTEFEYFIYAVSVTDSTGLPIGDPDNRLKQVDIYVRWYNPSAGSPGHGRTTHHQRRLISQTSGG